jgi:hypothetical protein
MRQLRHRGIYVLGGTEFVAFRRSEVLYFLFIFENWNYRGPVDYRFSHDLIFKRGTLTKWVGEDLFDTGRTAEEPHIH